MLFAYTCAPDFCLALWTHLRGQIAKASPHRKRILFSAADLGPKQIFASMEERGISMDTVKAERRKLRCLVAQIAQAKQQCGKAYQQEVERALKRLGQDVHAGPPILQR